MKRIMISIAVITISTLIITSCGPGLGFTQHTGFSKKNINTVAKSNGKTFCKD